NELSWKAQRLIARHRLRPQAEEREEEPLPPSVTPEATADASLEPTDRLLVPKREQHSLISVQRENLRRYLQRTADIPDPGRDLLFLEAGGAAEGLADPTL